MKTKTYFSNKILSLVLALVMVVGMLPTVNMSAYAVTEVENLGENTYSFYTDGLTQYLKYDNYLYKVTFTNLKATDKRVSVMNNSGEIYLSILGNGVGSSLYLLKNRLDDNTRVRTSDLPKDVGGSVSCYIYDPPNTPSHLSPADEWCTVIENPVVIITCVSAAGPQWSWADDHSSVNATFTVSEADVQVTLDADVSFVAEACSGGDDITYTASVTFNGKQYTDYKEAVKPHDWNKIEGQTCDQVCSRCGTVLEVAHTYDNTCDTDCNICTAKRETEHTYDNVCDLVCNVCYAERETGHIYDNDCDTICDACGTVRIVKHDVNGDYCTLCGEKLYGVLVAGNYITAQNASDVLGDGTVSYDAVTNTLTLNGANVNMTETNLAIHNDTLQEQKDRIDNNETFEPYFNPLTPPLQITGGELTLVLQGENTLIGLDRILESEIFEGFSYGVPAVSIADGASLTVTGDDTATLTLLSADIGYTERDHIPYTASISGGSLTVVGGTINTVNGIRLGGDYTQNGGSVEAGFLEAQNVTVFDGSLNARGYSGIYPKYSDEKAGGIHGIFARENISISGGYVWTASGVLGHNGNYKGTNVVTGKEVVTHGLYALESINVSGGTIISTGGEGGYFIGFLGELVEGYYDYNGEFVGTPAGSALEAPEWSISDEATFICGSDTSHRLGVPTCCGTFCSFCGILCDEAKDPDNHESTEITYTDNGNDTHTGVYACCNAEYVTNEAHKWDTTKRESNLTRPYQNDDNTWTDGYYTYPCKHGCGATTTEAVKRADYTAFDEAEARLEFWLQHAFIIPSAIEEYKAKVNNLILESGLEDPHTAIETEQKLIDEMADRFNILEEELASGFANGTLCKVSLKPFEDAEAIEEELIAKYGEEALSSIILSERTIERASEIHDEYSAIADNENATALEYRDDIKRLAGELTALYAELEICIQGVHNVETWSDNGENHIGDCVFCTATGITAEHTDPDDDKICDSGCGHEFEKPEEGFKPSLNAQTNADGSQIRFVTCVDSLNYKEVGFVITNANNKEQTVTKTSTTVYTSIIAGGKTVTAADITENEDMKYILTYTVTGLADVPDAAFEVTSFVVNLDGTKTYGETKTFTLADMLG